MKTVETKYNIGDILTPVIEPTGRVKMQVVEITVIQCYAATQINYHCRVYTQQYEGSTPAIVKTLFPFTEPEVKLHPEFAKATGKE